jgi:hypothetical protein
MMNVHCFHTVKKWQKKKKKVSQTLVGWRRSVPCGHDSYLYFADGEMESLREDQ